MYMHVQSADVKRPPHVLTTAYYRSLSTKSTELTRLKFARDAASSESAEDSIDSARRDAVLHNLLDSTVAQSRGQSSWFALFNVSMSSLLRLFVSIESVCGCSPFSLVMLF
uniref:Uncharacterized protein n=1 Tax=Lotharella globosa TaxID=91324 RepID=A0A7S3YQ07_9EUKA